MCFVVPYQHYSERNSSTLCEMHYLTSLSQPTAMGQLAKLKKQGEMASLALSKDEQNAPDCLIHAQKCAEDTVCCL